MRENLNLVEKKLALKKLEEQISSCTKCGLCQNTTNAVPGYGNANAQIVFIGEAPGKQEDLTGLPFVGRAGKFLDKLLESINLNRDAVWIGNIVKHRPPKNRDPLPTEVIACQPFLNKQLNIIKPQLIVTLGRYALYHFSPNSKISQDHGKVLLVNDYKIFPVYHPAATLRNPNFANALFEDFKKIPELLV